jgi:hypothetical protein
MSKPQIATIGIASVFLVGGVGCIAYWILEPGAPKAVLYAGAAVPLLCILLGGAMAVVPAIRDRGRP